MTDILELARKSGATWGNEADQLFMSEAALAAFTEAVRQEERERAEQDARRIRLSDYVNAAVILASDMPHVVVEKLQAAIDALAGAEAMSPVRVQLSRVKGWKMPPNTIKVARPGKWSNPYRVEVFGRDLAVRLFRESVQGFWSPSNVEHLVHSLALRAYECHRKVRENMRDRHLYELHGKNLACWCGLDEACHADVLLELANPDAARTTGGRE